MPKVTSRSLTGNKIPPHRTLLNPLQPVSIHCFSLGLFNWQWLQMVMLPRGRWSCRLPRGGQRGRERVAGGVLLAVLREGRVSCHHDHPVIFLSAHLCTHTCPSACIIFMTLTCLPSGHSESLLFIRGCNESICPAVPPSGTPHHTHLFPRSCSVWHDLSGMADIGRDWVFLSAYISPFLPGGASSLYVA